MKIYVLSLSAFYSLLQDPKVLESELSGDLGDVPERASPIRLVSLRSRYSYIYILEICYLYRFSIESNKTLSIDSTFEYYILTYIYMYLLKSRPYVLNICDICLYSYVLIHA